MASIEFITKRIEGKKKEIEKLTTKLGRIRKVEAQNWQDPNPYYYTEYDLRVTLRNLEEAKKSLQDYEAQLTTETEKSKSRNVQVIIDFLNSWKERTFNFYSESVVKYTKAYQEYLQKNSEYCEAYNSRKYSNEEWKKIDTEYHIYKKNFTEAWSWITPYTERKRNYETNTWEMKLNAEKLRKDLDQEANRKYDFIIERTNKIVGKITDASALRVGSKGDLNGNIRGTKGVAKIQTIGAGGYNIQCFHFRTLVNEA